MAATGCRYVSSGRIEPTRGWRCYAWSTTTDGMSVLLAVAVYMVDQAEYAVVDAVIARADADTLEQQQQKQG